MNLIHTRSLMKTIAYTVHKLMCPDGLYISNNLQTYKYLSDGREYHGQRVYSLSLVESPKREKILEGKGGF